MPIEGPLKELGIHDVFQLLDLSRKTGALRVTSELRHNSGTVYFENGAIVFAQIQSNPHPLGALLIRTGKITEADLERARDRQKKGDQRRVGEILVEMGAITNRELQRQVRFQVEEVVFEVMSWQEGYFSFSEGSGDAAFPAEAAVRIPTEALLMEGARRIDEWSRIEKRVPHVGIVPGFAGATEGQPGDLDLLPPEWEVLALIDGERDVRGVAAELGRSEFDVAKTLFGLESAGVIAFGERALAPGGRKTSAVTELVAEAEGALRDRDLEKARAAAEQAVALHAHDPGVHLLLGQVHLAAGRAPDAVEELRRTIRLDPLLAPAHRVLGFALVGVGRFAEGVDAWDRWERLAGQSETEMARVDEVRRARSAAQLLGGLGPGGGGG